MQPMDQNSIIMSPLQSRMSLLFFPNDTQLQAARRKTRLCKWNKARVSTPEQISSSFSRQPCSQGNRSHHLTAWMERCCSSPTHKDRGHSRSVRRIFSKPDCYSLVYLNPVNILLRPLTTLRDMQSLLDPTLALTPDSLTSSLAF